VALVDEGDGLSFLTVGVKVRRGARVVVALTVVVVGVVIHDEGILLRCVVVVLVVTSMPGLRRLKF
jgi:hypothetical protein